jgi:hypothetical protein
MPPEVLPEILNFFKDFTVVLAAPFFILLGVVINALVQRKRDKGTQVVAEETVEVTRDGVKAVLQDSETKSFQAIVDGFSRSFEIVERRAKAAETAAEKAEQSAMKAKEEVERLEVKIETLGRERNEAIDHIVLLESHFPTPPGPPPRPHWMMRTGPTPKQK